MRYFHMAVIALFALAVIIFLAQNLQIVTMTFLGFRASIPLALLVAIIYVLGMATGGSLMSLLRWSIEGSQQRAS
jgi:lipopolysaccharide assembly protein A